MAAQTPRSGNSSVGSIDTIHADGSSDSYSPRSVALPAGVRPDVPAVSPSTVSTSTVPKYITTTQTVTVKNASGSPDDRDAASKAAAAEASAALADIHDKRDTAVMQAQQSAQTLDQLEAAAKPQTKTVTKTTLNPAWVQQQQQLKNQQAQAAARSQAVGITAARSAAPAPVYTGAVFGTNAQGIPLNSSTRGPALGQGQLGTAGGYIYRSNGDGTYTNIGRATPAASNGAQQAFNHPESVGSLTDG
jgi:hypothetical protein